MIEFLTKFIEKYYVDPVRLGTGYNFVNSTTYALIFIAAIYLIFLLLRKMKIPIDKRFVIAIFPYAVLGSFVRVLEDAGIVKNYLLKTPMIWGIMVIFIACMFLVSILIQRKFNVPYFKTMFLVSIILIMFPLLMLKFRNFYSSLLVIGFLVPWILIFCFIRWKTENKLVALSHIFDATASFVAVNFFGFFELYPISRFLVGSNPFSFVIVKAFIVISILILIDRFSEDKEFNNYLKLIIGILGFAPGMRNFLSLLVLT